MNPFDQELQNHKTISKVFGKGRLANVKDAGGGHVIIKLRDGSWANAFVVSLLLDGKSAREVPMREPVYQAPKRRKR